MSPRRINDKLVLVFSKFSQIALLVRDSGNFVGPMRLSKLTV